MKMKRDTGWQYRRVQVCVFTGGNAFPYRLGVCSPLKVILSVVSNEAEPDQLVFTGTGWT